MTSALIFGRARNVWNEVVEARRLGSFDYTIAVGRAGCDYPGYIDCWVSFHAELFEKWSKQRKAHFFPLAGIMYWTARSGGRLRAAWCNGMRVNEVECIGGSSGMIAVKVALELYCDKIVLCGIPMTEEAGHYDDNERWDEARNHRMIWEQQLGELRGKVKSLSGWTQEKLGYPTTLWLNSDDTARATAAAAGA